MPKSIIWSKKALKDYSSQLGYLTRERGKDVATLVLNRIELAITKLSLMPLGKVGRVSGTFEKHIQKTSLIVVYQNEGDVLKIVLLIHTSRDWKEGEFPQ